MREWEIVHGLAKACVHAALCTVVVCVSNVCQFSMAVVHERVGNSTSS